ncbi:MAG: DUF4190 domain-containing protein [Planctomycetota bacterium]
MSQGYPPPPPQYGQPPGTYGQQYPGMYPGAGAQKTSGVAVTGFICSLLGLLFVIPLIPGIICSAIGISKTGPTKSRGRGLSIAGLVIGIFGIFWAAVLMGMIVAIGPLITMQMHKAVCLRTINKDLVQPIALGDYESAYNATHQNYRNHATLAQFTETYRADFEKFGGIPRVEIVEFEASDAQDQYLCEVKLTGSNNYVVKRKMLLRKQDRTEDGKPGFAIEADGLLVEVKD